MTNEITNSDIREYLGHNGHECRVIIGRGGSIKRHGSPNEFDRSQDYWANMGTVAEIKKEMASRMNVLT